MGGLVSKLLTEDSGDDFWRLVSNQPFESIKGRPETLAELRRLFFFQRSPCIRRVVFIGTDTLWKWQSLGPSNEAQAIIAQYKPHKEEEE